MGKKQILAALAFIILLAAIPISMYLIRQQQVFKSKANFVPKVEFLDEEGDTITQTSTTSAKLRIIKGTEEIDILDYFLSDHKDKALTGTHPLTQTVEGKTVYYTKWGPKAFERFIYDDEFIYLKEDHSGAPVNFYAFDSGKWLKRKMKMGEKNSLSDNIIQWYGPDCKPLNKGSFPIELTLERYIPEFDFGGDLGKQDTIVVKYDSSPGSTSGIYERLYYTKEWGWVQWEEYDKNNGSLPRNKSVFNKILSDPIKPDKSVACT